MAAKKKTHQVRLNKFIADAGIASRRKADELIEHGKVKVNGKMTYELGVKVDPSRDKVEVRGKPVRRPNQSVYIAFNKPMQVLSAWKDSGGRPCVGDYFKKLKRRLFPVGRLDWDSEGLLLLTNDGVWANKVMHPSKAIPKVYLVKVDGIPTDQQLDKLKRGVSIIGGRVHAQHIERAPGKSDKYQWIRITITGGKNRQIRRMFEKIGFDVKKLRRVAIGGLKLGQLKKGSYALLTPQQANKALTPPKPTREQ